MPGASLSVTTIPAAAYLGIAAALGEVPEAIGGLGVLVTNITMLVVGASLTLAVLRRRSAREVAGDRHAHADWAMR